MLFLTNRFLSYPCHERLAAPRPTLGPSETNRAAHVLACRPRGAGLTEITPAPYGCLGVGNGMPASRPGAATPNTFRTRSLLGRPSPSWKASLSEMSRLPAGSMTNPDGPLNPVSVARLPSPAYRLLPLPATV